MQSSQHERGEVSKKGLLTGFPIRHLRHLRWLVKNYISPPPSQWADPATPSILHSRIVPTATYSPWFSDEQFSAVYEKVKEHTLVDVHRCYELWTLAKNVAEIPGSILEVGVWRGGTGALLAAASPSKAVYLGDTFHGVVKASTKDTRYRGGEHADTSKAHVERLLRSLHLKNFILLEGIFPEETAHQVAGPIALLHCDVDVYASTRDIVEWTLPRLSPYGVMVFDDYGFSGCEGVTKYVNELRESSRDLFFIHNLNGHAILIKHGGEAHSGSRLHSTEKRRAHRVATSMPVLVYGHSAHAPFAEPATTANVSRTGGLVGLSTHVIRLQKLVVTNLQTNENAICRVARFTHNDDGHNFVGLEFLHPAPHFWALDFAGEPTSARSKLNL
jgi:O-methyltransferase